MSGLLLPWQDDHTEIQTELQYKHERILTWITERQLDALVIGRHENIAWATAGRVDCRIGMLRETGPVSLLFTRDGARYYITSNTEAERLESEEFDGLGFRPVIQPWHKNALAESLPSLAGRRIASDVPIGSTAAIPLLELRGTLTGSEIRRYRWLASAASTAVEQIALAIRPGDSERHMQCMLAASLLRQRIQPSVYLTAVDDRVHRYPHPVPRDGVLNRLAMVGLCARRWGLTVALTRVVHFGTPSVELLENFTIVHQVAARLLEATHKGVTSHDLFRIAQEAYAELGVPGAEQRHHQGGAIGYMEREWFARPCGADQILAQQAVAWNPSFAGAKCEETFLYDGGHLERLTVTPRLPQVGVRVAGNEHHFSDLLVR
jgi:Xaa-Pro dipeptidase